MNVTTFVGTLLPTVEARAVSDYTSSVALIIVSALLLELRPASLLLLLSLRLVLRQMELLVLTALVRLSCTSLVILLLDIIEGGST